MPELDLKALKEAKSLGEKLAIASANDLSAAWDTCREDVKAEFERIALAFAASLTHDETANATITALRASLEEAEGRERALEEAIDEMVKALTYPTGEPEDYDPSPVGRAKDLMLAYLHNASVLSEYAARAEASEQRESAALEHLNRIIAHAPSLPKSFQWTGTERAEDLFDAELRHANGKKPIDYLRAWLGMFRPFAYATRDDSWGELEKLIAITMNNVVKTLAAIKQAEVALSTTKSGEA